MSTRTSLRTSSLRRHRWARIKELTDQTVSVSDSRLLQHGPCPTRIEQTRMADAVNSVAMTGTALSLMLAGVLHAQDVVPSCLRRASR